MNIYVIMIVIMALSLLVQSMLQSRFNKYSKVPTANGMTGAEVARRMLQENGIYDVQVVSVRGTLTDHYNPQTKTVNLSEGVFASRSVAAAAVAAHECGHAVQHALGYAPLRMRSALVPVVSFASNIVQWVLLAGIIFFQAFPGLLWFGIALFATTTIFSFITLPVEVNASTRAISWLENAGVTDFETRPMAIDALKWAAYTYVIAALGSLATLIYYIGLAGGISNAEMMAGGEEGAKIAFSAVFSNFAGTFLFVFVVISCIGTLNGLMLGNTRGLYSCAMHSDLKSFKIFKHIDPNTNMATNSAITGLLLAAGWLLYFYGSVITTIGGNAPWFGQFSFDASELPIVTVYGMYLPIFVAMFFKEKGLGFFKGKIAPVAAMLASIFMVGAAIYAHGIAPYLSAKANGEFSMPILFYLIIYAVIMIIGVGFLVAGNKKKAKK